MTRESILSALEQVGTPRHSWRFVRRSSLHLLAVLLDAMGPSRSSFPKAPGYLAACGKALNEAGERIDGPTQECVDLAYVAWIPTSSKRQCLAPCGFIPRGVRQTDSGGCAFAIPDAIRASSVQTSPAERSPSVAEAGRYEVDGWLHDALRYASKHGSEEVSHAAEAHLHDRYCTPEESILLGTYLSGYLEGSTPWLRVTNARRSTTPTAPTPAPPDAA